MKKLTKFRRNSEIPSGRDAYWTRERILQQINNLINKSVTICIWNDQTRNLSAQASGKLLMLNGTQLPSTIARNSIKTGLSISLNTSTYASDGWFGIKHPTGFVQFNIFYDKIEIGTDMDTNKDDIIFVNYPNTAVLSRNMEP